MLRQIVRWIRNKGRNIRNLDLRRNVKYRNISLITSNCIGGIMYHDMGLQFCSPTINLFFHPDDFITFCECISNFKGEGRYSCTQVYEDGISYPIGEFTCVVNNENKVFRCHFMHYKTYEEALNKWKQRAERIELDKIFIIMTDTECTEEHLNKFQALTWKNKIFVTSNKQWKDKENVAYIGAYRNDKINRLLTSYQGVLGKRYIDNFNYVKWINKAMGN